MFSTSSLPPGVLRLLGADEGGTGAGFFRVSRKVESGATSANFRTVLCKHPLFVLLVTSHIGHICHTFRFTDVGSSFKCGLVLLYKLKK